MITKEGIQMADLAHDVINQLLNIHPDSELAAVRQIRDGATENTQKAFEVILDARSEWLTLPMRYFIAERVSRQLGSDVLADFYQDALGNDLVDDNNQIFQTALVYVDVINQQPKQAQFSLVQALLEKGILVEDVILLAQLATFVTYQARLILGLQLLQGQGISHVANAVRAGIWNQQVKTQLGKKAPVAFTQENLGWEPWLTIRDEQTLQINEAKVMKKHGQLHSEYFLLLAHHSKILEIRTLIDRGVFYTPQGMPRWEREFAAAAVSKVNGCIYCASVHARKACQYEKKRTDDVNRLLQTAAGEILAQGFDKRLLAITEFVAALSATPVQVTTHQFEALKNLGFSQLELLDLIQSTAFFSWANRLMLSLGEPFELSVE